MLMQSENRVYYDAIYAAVAREYPHGGAVFASQLQRALDYVESNWDLGYPGGRRPDPRRVANDAIKHITSH